MSNCPVPYTCPTIDSAIEDIKKAIDIATSASSDVENILDDLVQRCGTLEEIRSANEQLRQWGESLEEELEETRKELNDLQKEYSRVLSEIAYHEQQNGVKILE